jgi:hypothetical protein
MIIKMSKSVHKRMAVQRNQSRMKCVYCEGCSTFHLVDDVEFVNISEDMQGEDRLTFVCPVDSKTYTGGVYG